MTSKYGTKTLTEILNLDSVKVNSYRQHEGIGIILQVELKSTCPRCGKKSHRLPKSSIFGEGFAIGQAVYLEVNRRQFKCDSAKKPFSEDLDSEKKNIH